ncbi:LysR substrate-binding domain-containing protein [Vibrio neptunius]|uniref:LysR family transcriptional regulator n=1 Tax=Vibrio neptunius TaxID=170651 RepID=A0ABS2ZY38_9VIBR|nr:LysR family transcriptional regulator [Vibrio neptunius]MBN3515052.1 LysR family transcriptional regulator [Vibrio neptunius]MBN3548688.1 LysR family transcriptional regulator [Vibrio neptunius]MBN3577180.1 LysR family transcriptional regulator [Vibrio neptunius]MCH9870845.1 LysR family transcriptional regulator [Vibrio neptunius]
MLNQINLADIRSFVLIAQLGNFTKAAEALGVSRSHVSRQISSLENQIGVTLLIRTTRTLKLTEAGKAFYQQCERALHNIDQALLAAVDDVEKVQGEIKINCVGGYLGEELIAQIATEFMHVHPDVSIHLDFSSHRVDLIEDDFDIAFRMGKLEDSGFVARKLLDIQMGTLASPDYLKRYGQPNHPKELTQHHCLSGSVKRWSFESKADAQHYDVFVNGHMQCKNGRVLVKGALNGNGIIRVPMIYCEQELANGKLVEVFDHWGIPSVDFSAIYHRDRFQPKRLREFISFVKHYFDARLADKESA